jgi:hypothetical protein
MENIGRPFLVTTGVLWVTSLGATVRDERELPPAAADRRAVSGSDLARDGIDSFADGVEAGSFEGETDL